MHIKIPPPLIALTAAALMFGVHMFIPLFILYLTQFQIKPEEKAMQKLFGDAFDAYKAKVRRWI